ncbi:MAG: ribonuclease R [Nitrospiraceae bacterium]|nr:MAG: ribonuclease R [Nitrospiraceae bacterium]
MIRKDIHLKDSVLTFLRTKTSRPVNFKEIARALGIQRKGSRTLRRVLYVLIKSGEIFRTKKGFYGLVREMNLVTGLFEAHRDGYGFVIPETSGERDLFIPPRKTMAAMSGDRVVARLESIERREASIIKILERGKKKIIGTFHREDNLFYVTPKSRNIPFGIVINPKNRKGAAHGSKVSVEIISYPTMNRPPEGKVLKVLTDVTEPSLETDMIIEEYSLPRKFPASVLSAVKDLSSKISLRNRKDCRSMFTVTIDGETAKDFDDAISIERNDKGFILYVHIADVSHYVPWESEIDLEARRRGTSVYFPGSVIPMLPEKLSNDLCSLVPKQDRPTFTVEMHFDNNAQIIDSDFYPSIIHSNERMTYTSVKKILVDNDSDVRSRYSYLINSFETMEKLCALLRRKRISRGSLDFDLPEPEILLDMQGRPEAVIQSERNLAHMMVEEFMIAANEAVASYLEEAGIPSVYRVHEEPDTTKIDELKPVLAAFGIHIKKAHKKTFHSVLKKTKGREEESIINILLLRSLKQARYSTENIGHFGLASTCYTHFTSPIRRYPDLIVHRMLRSILGKKQLSDRKKQAFSKLLPDLAVHSSRTERTAEEAEREIVNAMRVWFMKDKVGDEYTGIVTNVTSHGLKIKLTDFFIEGYLNVSSMSDDYYRFDEKNYRLIGRRKKRMFSIGNKLTVRVESVDTEERNIIFGLV